MKDRIYLESINEFTIDGYKIRVWRKQKPGFNESEDTDEIRKVVKRALKKDSYPEKIAKRIIKLKGVNAVDCKIATRTHGAVVYKNWP